MGSKKKILIIVIILFVILLVIGTSSYYKKDTLQIDVGYQSVTSQTWGALIIKNKNIFTKKLQEKYPDKKVKVIWHDEISGAVINTNMISNKIQIGFMGDMPLILNMSKSATLDDYESSLIAFDGKGESGKNQSILVPKNSEIKEISDLEGKVISTPIGSSAHYMLMKVLEKYDLLDKVEIVHQDVALASQLLKTKKTDAFAIWAPYPNFLVNEGSAEILAEGTESEIDYLAGVIVNNNWAKENKDIVQLFIDSLEEAHKFIKENPKEAAKIFSIENGFNQTVTETEVKSILWDTSITTKDIDTLKDKQDFLINLKQVDKFDLDKYIYKGE